MDREYAEYLLEETRKNYNQTAESYARTRAFIPEDIKLLAGYAQKGDRVLDSGCASGRLYGVLKDRDADYMGIDFSDRLISIAQKTHPEAKFQAADTLNLPLPDDYFDKVYSISVIHNIPSGDFQLQYLKEAKRVLRPGGLLILRVWDFWKRKTFPALFLKHTFLKIFGKSKLDLKDVFLPWKDSNGNVLVWRYFHAFTKKEIENLVEEAGFTIKKSWRAGKDPRANIYLIAEK
jgi:ubiquinone/menaquinone biosynthesis C-methylase UbiE